jgi:hypothetical protein
LVTSDPTLAADFITAGPTVAKAVAEARVEGPFGAYSGETFEVSTELEGSVLSTPVLLQRRIGKVADLRVTVIGHKIFPVRVTAPRGAPLDIRQTPPADCVFEAVALAPPLASALLRYVDAFGLRFGAFDLAEDAEGTRWFLECNPAGQWGWLELATGLPMTEALLDLLLAPDLS